MRDTKAQNQDATPKLSHSLQTRLIMVL